METVEENHNNELYINKKIINNGQITDVSKCDADNCGNKTDLIDNFSAQCTETKDNTNANENVVDTSNTEEPMDLTFSQKGTKRKLENVHNGQKRKLADHCLDAIQTSNSSTVVKLVQGEQLVPHANPPKKRGRKRKEISIEINNALSCTPSLDNPELVQIDSRQGEVLTAAKSLFSKRTRTLYHWMYPNAPKAQLKSAVSMSWETLGIQEKEFYISQVLGRFGFPQSSLMVNPQLGGLRGVSVQPPLDLSTPAHLNLEAHAAVSTILEDQANEPGTSWANCSYTHSKKNNKKRGPIGRPPGTKNEKIKDIEVKPVAVEPIHDDFPDDPELRKEFEQFKWALHMTDK